MASRIALGAIFEGRLKAAAVLLENKGVDKGVVERFKDFSNGFFGYFDEKCRKVWCSLLQIKLNRPNTRFFQVPSSRYFTLMHGDFWSNNMLFKEDPETNEPKEVKLIDFQMTGTGEPFYDIGYYLHISTDAAFRY